MQLREGPGATPYPWLSCHRRKNAKDYTQRALDAEAYGDKGLMVQLEDMVRDESGHSEETERMLRDWPL